MMNWYDRDQFAAPSIRDTWYGREHTWKLKLPAAVAATIAPACGTKCEGIAKLAAPGISGIGSTVIQSLLSKDKDHNYTLTVVIAEPQALGAASGNVVEIKGSRSRVHGPWPYKFGVMRYVTTKTNPEAYPPTEGVTYYTTRAGTVESGAAGRSCMDVDYNWEMFAGAICLITARFKGLAVV